MHIVALMLAMDSTQSLSCAGKSFIHHVIQHMVKAGSSVRPCTLRMYLKVPMAQSCSQDSLHAQGKQAANVVMCMLSLAPSGYLRNGCGGVKLCQLHIPVPH